MNSRTKLMTCLLAWIAVGAMALAVAQQVRADCGYVVNDACVNGFTGAGICGNPIASFQACCNLIDAPNDIYNCCTYRDAEYNCDDSYSWFYFWMSTDTNYNCSSNTNICVPNG